MNKPIVFMFSGQGSQYFHMGKALYQSLATFRHWMDRLDDDFYILTGISVVSQLYDANKKKHDPFDNFLLSHVALFMVEYSLAQVLIERGIMPDYVLGCSLGEFTACSIAEVIGYETVLRNLVEQVYIVQECCRKGGMLAILHRSQLFEEQPVLHLNAELVAINYHSHFVVSGSLSGLQAIVTFLEQQNILYQRLPVPYAFHSSFMDPAAASYMSYLNSQTFRKPTVSYISCLTGDQVTAFEPEYFWRIGREPINFPDAITYLEQTKEFTYIDLGPSGTLANFTKYYLNPGGKSTVYDIMTPFNTDLKNLEILSKDLRRVQI